MRNANAQGYGHSLQRSEKYIELIGFSHTHTLHTNAKALNGALVVMETVSDRVGVTARAIRWGSSRTQCTSCMPLPRVYKNCEIQYVYMHTFTDWVYGPERTQRGRGPRDRNGEAWSRMKERQKSLKWGRLGMTKKKGENVKAMAAQGVENEGAAVGIISKRWLYPALGQRGLCVCVALPRGFTGMSLHLLFFQGSAVLPAHNLHL